MRVLTRRWSRDSRSSIDFGRAVSRILSAPNFSGGENHLSQQPVPETCPANGTRSGQLPGFLFGLAPDGVFRASAIALGAVGSYPAFSPLPPAEAGGGLIFCGTFRRKVVTPSARVYPARWPGYAASRPVEFGLSSPAPFSRPGSDSPPFQNQEYATTLRP